MRTFYPLGFYPNNQKLELPRNEQLTVLQESTAQLFSIELSHFRIVSKDSKIRITFHSIISSTTGKYCSVAFI